ncbi:hypothetical protein AcV7_010035 [Taiwanofungus camphoratus]|nr:hypothetical protein AcV7_010035 [Antrodia cinnamomea]
MDILEEKRGRFSANLTRGRGERARQMTAVPPLLVPITDPIPPVRSGRVQRAGQGVRPPLHSPRLAPNATEQTPVTAPAHASMHAHSILQHTTAPCAISVRQFRRPAQSQYRLFTAHRIPSSQ